MGQKTVIYVTRRGR